MAAWKIAPALACGNSVVLKPSEETPLSALLLAELLQEAELPDGVLNVLPGRGEDAGARLAAHPDVDKIAFTGSTEVGKLIARASADSNLKRVSLELGGKSPNIVFADADLSRAVSGAFFGIFFNQGQVCSAGSRLFVQEKIYDQALDELLKTVEQTRIGPGIDPVTQMGPLVSKTQMERVLGYIQTGSNEGARLLAGGGRPEGPGCAGEFRARRELAALAHERGRVLQVGGQAPDRPADQGWRWYTCLLHLPGQLRHPLRAVAAPRQPSE